MSDDDGQLSIDQFLNEQPPAWRSEFNRAASMQARDEGMENVIRNRGWFSDAVLPLIIEIAQRMETFTTDDVWWAVHEHEIEYSGDKRVMGPVMKRAEKEGVCARVDQTERTIRKTAHRRPLQVWRSLLL